MKESFDAWLFWQDETPDERPTTILEAWQHISDHLGNIFKKMFEVESTPGSAGPFTHSFTPEPITFLVSPKIYGKAAAFKGLQEMLSVYDELAEDDEEEPVPKLCPIHAKELRGGTCLTCQRQSLTSTGTYSSRTTRRRKSRSQRQKKRGKKR